MMSASLIVISQSIVKQFSATAIISVATGLAAAIVAWEDLLAADRAASRVSGRHPDAINNAAVGAKTLVATVLDFSWC
jgi:hypothetical protein